MSLLHKCLKTALFLYRATAKMHQFSIETRAALEESRNLDLALR
jgi:hypothetical protein